MSYHPITQQIIDLLKKQNCWYETFTHEPVLTSEQAAQVRPGYSLLQGAKAILAKIEKKNKEEVFIMLVLPGDRRLDSKKIKKTLNVKNLRFATEEELTTVTRGIQRGAVPPFGNLFQLEVYVDRHLQEEKKIVFNAGDRKFSVAMNSKDYFRLVNPQIVEMAV